MTDPDPSPAASLLQQFRCDEPAPDGSGRRCDHPAGHAGNHWAYGAEILDWAPAASPGVDPWEQERERLERRYCAIGPAKLLDEIAAERQQHTGQLEEARHPRPLNLSELWDETGRQRESSPCEHDQGDSLVVWYDDLVDFKQRFEAEVASLTQQLTEAQTQIATLRAKVQTISDLSKQHEAACRRAFGDVVIEHTGRAGGELQALLDAAASLTGDQP